MTSDNVPAKPAAGRGLRIALMASLALNVLIIGGVATTLLCFGGKGHHHRGSGLMGFVETLPSERAKSIGDKLKADREALRPLRQAQREARGQARSALMAQPFDASAFRTALDNAATAGYEEKKARMGMLADLAAELTPDERQQLHQWFEKRRRHFRHGPKDDGDDDDAAPPPKE